MKYTKEQLINAMELFYIDAQENPDVYQPIDLMTIDTAREDAEKTIEHLIKFIEK